MPSSARVNIAHHLPEMARLQPDSLAVAFPVGRDHANQMKYEQWTYGRLDQQSDQIARGLNSVGITRGVRTVLMVQPGPNFFALVFALFKIGAVMVGVDPGLGVRRLKRCLDEAEPEAFIGIAKAHLARRLFGWGKSSNRINVLVGSSWAPLGKTVRLDEIHRIGAKSQGPVLTDAPAEATAAILFTSGSTGSPKGVVYTHGNFDAQVRALQEHFQIQPGEIDLCTFPLFALYAPAMGMSAIVPEMDFTRPATVEPANIIEPVQQFEVTNLFGSPALLRQVGRYAAKKGISLPSLKRVISAGAPVPTSVVQTFAGLLGRGVQVHTPYGATESLPVSSIGSDEILSQTSKSTEEGRGICVGKPVSDMRVRIIGISDEPIEQWVDALEVADGQIGEIVVQGSVTTAEYFHREDATRLAKIKAPTNKNPDAFFHRMGDLGYIDDTGRLWMCGRKAHRVKMEQEELYTVPCEGVFNACPGVARTALVGVERNSKIRGALCVELDSASGHVGQSKESIREVLLERGAAFEHTRQIEDILFHPGFPVDIRHNAKIDRSQLARWAERKLS